MIDRTMDAARSLMFQLCLPVLYKAGLGPAVEWLVGKFQWPHDFACTFVDDGQAKPLDDDARIQRHAATGQIGREFKGTKVIGLSVHNSGRIASEMAGLEYNTPTATGITCGSVSERANHAIVPPGIRRELSWAIDL